MLPIDGERFIIIITIISLISSNVEHSSHRPSHGIRKLLSVRPIILPAHYIQSVNQAIITEQLENIRCEVISGWVFAIIVVAAKRQG